jgi:hypothetical protein
LVGDVHMFTNPALRVRGIIATMFNQHTMHNRSVLAELGHRHGIPVFDPPVRRTIRFAEATPTGMCLLEYAPDSAAGEAYRRVAEAIDSDVGTDGEFLSPGSRVSVRDRFQGRWTDGFDIAEIRDSEYVLRRLSDDSILPGSFKPDEVRGPRAVSAWA